MNILSASSSLTANAALQKLRIYHEEKVVGTYSGQINAMFNPAQLKFSKEVSWELSPVAGQNHQPGYHRLGFLDSKPATLAIELFFDTYEGPPVVDGGGRLTEVSGVDVSQYTKQVAGLANVQEELHRPPRCKLMWGKFALIAGVLTSLSEDYSFFLPDGTPVRATLSCSFTEVIDADSAGNGSELHSADVTKRWTVKLGDTLASIAQASYRDATKWRVIAEANGIDDPRRLAAGRILTIPKLTVTG